jgi:hypothetical protein
MGRRACGLEPARHVRVALRLLVGRWHSHGAAQRELGRPMLAGHHRRETGRQQRGDTNRDLAKTPKNHCGPAESRAAALSLAGDARRPGTALSPSTPGSGLTTTRGRRPTTTMRETARTISASPYRMSAAAWAAVARFCRLPRRRFVLYRDCSAARTSHLHQRLFSSRSR